jgi:hypothetical protein
MIRSRSRWWLWWWWWVVALQERRQVSAAAVVEKLSVQPAAGLMSDYGDDELDWDDPNVLAELESLESNAAASVGRTNPPRE